jgi:3D (Asp-Asp-Asp) domain-containing protein/septal ring factor EnvC (AmiA/AmiB activator)
MLVVIVAIAVLAAPAVSGAGHSPTTSSLQAQDAAIAAKSRAAVLGLYSLDQQLAVARTHLASLHAQLATLRAERSTLRKALTVAQSATKQAQKHLARRLQLLYERGEVEPIEILLGSRSLDEAMTSIDNLKGMTKQDAMVLREVTGARTAYGVDARKLASRVAVLAAATQQAAAVTASLEQTRAQRTSYVASLAAQRRLTQHQIASLVARAHAAQQRSAQLAAAPAFSSISSTSAAIAPVNAVAVTSGRSLSVVATGYALGGTTATGLPVGWGVAAVDPSVIPLGTHMSVPGYGEAVAADTGGAVVGNTIDLWFPSVAQANAWGRRVVTISLH